MEYGVFSYVLFLQMLLRCRECINVRERPKVKQPGRKEGKREALHSWVGMSWTPTLHLQNLHLPVFYCPIICRNHWYCVAASQQPVLQSQICEICGGVKTMQCLLWSGLISWKLEKSFAHIMQIEF